jgi:hypothetical protein
VATVNIDTLIPGLANLEGINIATGSMIIRQRRQSRENRNNSGSTILYIIVLRPVLAAFLGHL